MSQSLRFGGSVVQRSLGVGYALLLTSPLVVVHPWYGLVVIGAGWGVGALQTFRLDCTEVGLTRKVGGWSLSVAWAEVSRVCMDWVPGCGRIRFVLTDTRGQQISCPLFLLDIPERQQLAGWLAQYLLPAVYRSWQEQHLQYFLPGSQGNAELAKDPPC